MSDESTASSVPPRDEALEDFLDKWRARWPEWRIAQVFVPEAQRALVEAWYTLLQELVDAAWAGRDTAPGFAKLAWWQDELRGWRKGARRHPLGRVLQKQAAPWELLADALPALQACRDAIDAGLPESIRIERLQACGGAIAKIEAMLFVDSGASVSESDIAGMADARARALLCAHALGHAGDADSNHDAGRNAGQDAGQGANAAPRLQAPAWLSAAPSGPRPRRIVDAWCRARIRTQRPLPLWRALFVAWRAARG